MGKVRIMGGGSGGLYTVQRVYNDRLYQAKKARLEADIQAYQASIKDYDDRLAQLQPVIDKAIADLDEAEAMYIEAASTPGGDVKGMLKYLGDIQANMAKVYGEQAVLKTGRGIEQTKLTAAQKDMSMLESAANSPAESAWCADLSEHAAGEVASIEVPGEPQTLLIRPQYGGRGVFDGARDGQLMPREWQDAHQVYLNAAAFPGWQKFMPTYRTGTLTSKSGDTGTVALDATTSSAQGLPVNSVGSVTAPIEYMSCGGDAFEVGDRVVVEFTGRSWASPKIIGFAAHPRECPASWPMFVYDATIESSTTYGAEFDVGSEADSLCCLRYGTTSYGGTVCEELSPYVGLAAGGTEREVVYSETLGMKLRAVSTHSISLPSTIVLSEEHGHINANATSFSVTVFTKLSPITAVRRDGSRAFANRTGKAAVVGESCSALPDVTISAKKGITTETTLYSIDGDAALRSWLVARGLPETAVVTNLATGKTKTYALNLVYYRNRSPYFTASYLPV